MIVSPMNPGYLALPAAAAWAGVSVRTVKRCLARGLPIHQAGPREKVLIRPADIEAFLNRKVAPTVDLNAMVEDVCRDLHSVPAKRQNQPLPEGS